MVILLKFRFIFKTLVQIFYSKKLIILQDNDFLRPDIKVQNDPHIHINKISDETVHRETILVLQVFIGLVLFVQNPVCEKVHMERNETDTHFVKHFQIVGPSANKAVVMPDVNEHYKVRQIKEKHLNPRNCRKRKHDCNKNKRNLVWINPI
mgnify:CR=1 FL=1